LCFESLEEPTYDIEKDDLYEVSSDAFQFLLKCSQGEHPPIRQKIILPVVPIFVLYYPTEELPSVDFSAMKRWDRSRRAFPSVGREFLISH
jgi:hypothetical protein